MQTRTDTSTMKSGVECPRWIRDALLLGMLLLALAWSRPAFAQATLPTPTNIRCTGYTADEVRISFTDRATTEDGYKIERKTGNGEWIEIAQHAPRDNGAYRAYRDKDLAGPVTNYQYRVRAYRSSDDSYSSYSAACQGRRVHETAGFRFFYGVAGQDLCPALVADGLPRRVCVQDVDLPSGVNQTVQLSEDAYEGSVAAFARLGFDRSAGEHASLDKIPVNITWCDGGGCASGSDRMGIAPSLMETPFDVETRQGRGDAWSVVVHELFHFQQNRYGPVDDPFDDWIYEGQARSIQDKICMGPSRGDCVHLDDITNNSADYLAQVNGYLGNPDELPLIERSYSTALFWTYLVDHYGTSAPDDDVEHGMNLLVEFWQESSEAPRRDGISILNSALQNLGHDTDFRAVWQDFAVANIAKHYSGPAKYAYRDMAEAGGSYNRPELTLNRPLSADAEVVLPDEFLSRWTPRYYVVRPATDVPVLDVKVSQDSTAPLYYTLLGIDAGEIVFEQNMEARNFSHALLNDTYDEVILVVAAMERNANYRISINGKTPTLSLLEPTFLEPAFVGDPSAPGKMRVAVELLDAAGLPLPDPSLDRFSFAVDGVDLPATNILAAATVFDQQWFVLQAPAPSAPGRYSLTVRYGTAMSASEASAVVYQARNAVDTMILLDRSGSMASDDKLEAAQTAARFYLDSWQNGDGVGFGAFDDSVTPTVDLRPWLDRQPIAAAIDMLVPGGQTAIGDALRYGWDELKDAADETHDWGIVLLSDGQETDGLESFAAVTSALENARKRREKIPAVHAVAVGFDADQAGMQAAAIESRGTYQFVALPGAGVTAAAADTTLREDFFLDLSGAYRNVAGKLLEQQRTFSSRGPAGATVSESTAIPVENGADLLLVTVSWVNGAGVMGDLALTDPAGNGAPTPLIVRNGGTGHALWRVAAPAGGDWILSVNGRMVGDVVDIVPAYEVAVSLNSFVTLDVRMQSPTENPAPGVPITFLAFLTGSGPITGATIQAVIEPLSVFGETIVLDLADDGRHGDGTADDGLYGAVLPNPTLSATYQVAITADGFDAVSGDFHREESFAFYVAGDDRDGDGLSDGWEELHGTDPDADDAQEDPDADGLPNLTEQDIGSDPNNPDSDGGGTVDSADPNPTDPDDDTALYTWAYAHAGIAQIDVRYARPQEYARVALYRRGPGETEFAFLAAVNGEELTGRYVDTDVVNGEEYCYILDLRLFDFQSAQTEATCATPAEDPVAPHGLVRIDDADGVVLSADVTLLLWASDAIDPEHAHADEELLPDHSASGVAEMMIANSANFIGSTWEPFAQSKPWQLAGDSGVQTVYVKYRDGAGNESLTVATSVLVDPDAPGTGPAPVDENVVYLPYVLNR